jgi:biopolymer transport protein ExbB/TolQ
MLGVSLALLVYATGAEIGKLLLSSMTVFFSTRHLTPKAAQLQQTLAALEEVLTLRRDREGELRTGPMEKGMRVRLPDNALVRDLVTVQERRKSYDYAEYVVHSYYVECQELYDHSGAHLDFVSGAMPLFGLMGTVLGLISMFDSLGSVVTVEAIAPQLALALKCTLYGALYSSFYKINATRFEQRLKGLDYDFDTLCRALKVIFENQAVIEVQK